MHTGQYSDIVGNSIESPREHDLKVRDYHDDKTQKTLGRIFDSGFFAKKKLSGLLQIMLLARETK